MLLDMKGPEIRTGMLYTGTNTKIELKDGQKFTLVNEDITGNEEKVSVSYKELYKDVAPGAKILIDDGAIELRVDEIAKLERFGELSARNLVTAIGASKHPSLAKFITALGIRHVGAQTAVSLARRFKSLEALIDATEDELLEINDIGVVVAEAILAWFADEDNTKLLEDLKELGVWPLEEVVGGLPLEGKSYIVTGTLESMGREEAEDELRELGATVTSSVTKNTTALIVGDKPGKSKLEKATKLGIPTISEAEFLNLLSQ